MSKQVEPTHKVVSPQEVGNPKAGEVTWRTGTLQECERYCEAFRVMFGDYNKDIFVVKLNNE